MRRPRRRRICERELLRSLVYCNRSEQLQRLLGDKFMFSCEKKVQTNTLRHWKQYSYSRRTKRMSRLHRIRALLSKYLSQWTLRRAAAKRIQVNLRKYFMRAHGTVFLQTLRRKRDYLTIVIPSVNSEQEYSVDVPKKDVTQKLEALLKVMNSLSQDSES